MAKRIGLLGDDNFVASFQKYLQKYELYVSSVPSIFHSLFQQFDFDIVLSQLELILPETVATLFVLPKPCSMLSIKQQFIHSSSSVKEILHRLEFLADYLIQEKTYAKVFHYSKTHISPWMQDLKSKLEKLSPGPTVIIGEKGSGKHFIMNSLIQIKDLKDVGFITYREKFMDDVLAMTTKTMIFSRFDDVDEESASQLMNYIDRNNIQAFFICEHVPNAEEIQSHIVENNLIFVPPLRQRPETVDFFVDALLEGSDENIIEAVKFQVARYHWPKNFEELKLALEIFTSKGLPGLQNHIDQKLNQLSFEIKKTESFANL